MEDLVEDRFVSYVRKELRDRVRGNGVGEIEGCIVGLEIVYRVVVEGLGKFLF